MIEQTSSGNSRSQFKVKFAVLVISKEINQLDSFLFIRYNLLIRIKTIPHDVKRPDAQKMTEIGFTEIYLRKSGLKALVMLD